ncbi:MAG: hypothetical protein CVT70_01715 [Alphaproteobacteria bacterium HGW-Alphaproteobacteria-1]|jgi:hypothetical protein|nr:MAG: hypothetical protein CVT70_01715 [Alphaproteobacteria bacterium HGW-Alphaproteobacteria-1]
MPARLWLALVLLSWCAAMAQAGAWPREKGQVFLSFSSQFDERDENGIMRQSYGFYAEYGAAARLTLGLDVNGDALRMSKAIAFVRWSVGDAQRPLKLAVELGAGQVEDEAALRPGLSIGRGFSLGERHGWLNADLRAILGGDTTFETELTAGLSVTPRAKVIVQLQAGMPEGGQDYLRLAPSLVYQMRPGAQIELGLLEPLSGGGERGFKLGLWRQF